MKTLDLSMRQPALPAREPTPGKKGETPQAVAEPFFRTGWRLLLATALVLGFLAGGLRFYRLGSWPFFGDELATFHEADAFLGVDGVEATSQIARLPRMIPLSYLVLNAGYQLFGRDEFGSRAMMAVLGTAQVVLVFLGLVGPLGYPTALATALLLTVWPEHIFESQQHRFYMTASFFASLCMLAGGQAVSRRSMLWTALACLAALATILAHTLQGLVLGGLFVGLLLGARGRGNPILRAQLSVVAATIVLALAFLGLYLLPGGKGWNSGQGWGASSGHSLLASIYEVGWPIALLAGLGAVGVLKREDGQGWYWLAWAGLWATVSVVLPRFVVYHSAYVFPLTLGVMVLAGQAVGQIYTLLRRQSLAMSAAWIGIVAAFSLPSLVSHYRDGSRHDYRTAAQFITGHWHKGDQVAAVAPGALRYYSEECKDAVSLTNWDPLPDLEELSHTNHRLWIVIPSHRPGKSEELRRWLSQHGTQELEIRPQRFDYREHVVEVYLLEPQSVASGR